MQIGDILTEEELDNLADQILEAVDYDIFKEDLENRVILDYIYCIIGETIVTMD